MSQCLPGEGSAPPGCFWGLVWGAHPHCRKQIFVHRCLWRTLLLSRCCLHCKDHVWLSHSSTIPQIRLKRLKGPFCLHRYNCKPRYLQGNSKSGRNLWNMFVKIHPNTSPFISSIHTHHFSSVLEKTEAKWKQYFHKLEAGAGYFLSNFHYRMLF